MSDAISMELQFFLVSILWGVIILVIYDVLRIFRRVVKHKWFFVAVEDVLFWIVSAFLIFRMMYQQNNGTIRGFSILGMTLGMIVYNQSLSQFVVKGISRIFLFINKGIHKILSFLAKPFSIISRRIKRILLFLKKKCNKNRKLFLKALKKDKKQDTITVKKKRASKGNRGAKSEKDKSKKR